jgi:hypothetical protein
VRGVPIYLFAYFPFFLVLEVMLGRYSILISFLMAISTAVLIDSLSLAVVINGKRSGKNGRQRLVLKYEIFSA